MATPHTARINLGEWCVQRGLATQEKINECLRLQHELEAAGKPVRLGEILIQQGILTAADVARALAEQQKQIYACGACGVRVNVQLRSDAAGYRCARCKGTLAPLADLPDVRVEGEDMIVDSRDPLPPEVAEAMQDPAARFGKYVLLKEIGSGGVGQIYKAWDTYLSQYVALKRLRAAEACEPVESAEARMMSLVKEARHSVRLRHPGIITVFDIGRVNREFYMSMEYLEGETLLDGIVAARLRGKPSPFYEDPKRTLNQLGEVATAVHYAHTRPSPIIHCDLKPGNILIDSGGHTHVLDFGLARSTRIDRGGDGEISGTPAYMAPEQAAGKNDEIDPRTDVYALGAILYELLTGQPPFVGETIDVICRTIDELPDAPTKALHDTTRRLQKDGTLSTRQLLRVPTFLENLCMQCLRKSRFERPQSMQEFVSLIVQGLRREAQRPAVAQP